MDLELTRRLKMNDRRKLMLALMCTCAALGTGALAHADPIADAQKAARDAGKKVKDAADKAVKDAMGNDHAKPAGADDAAMWGEMMKMAQPGEPHKIIQQFEGTWDAEVKYWMDPSIKEPSISKGTMEAKLVHGGRFIMGDYKGAFAMPGPDGKMQNMPFTGTLNWGYNNIEKRYESTWNDSMGTGMMVSMGQATSDGKVVDSSAEFKMPGPDGTIMNIKQREKLTMVSPDRYLTEMWHSDGARGEMKVMEITYTRMGKASDKPADKKPGMKN